MKGKEPTKFMGSSKALMHPETCHTFHLLGTIHQNALWVANRSLAAVAETALYSGSWLKRDPGQGASWFSLQLFHVQSA